MGSRNLSFEFFDISVQGSAILSTWVPTCARTNYFETQHDGHSPRPGTRVGQGRKVWIVGVEIAKHGELLEVPRHVADDDFGIGVGILNGVADSKHCLGTELGGESESASREERKEERERERTSLSCTFPTADRYKKSLV